MPEETPDFTSQDIINDMYPQDTPEDQSESPEVQETEEEVLAGDASEETEEPAPEEEEPTVSDEGDEYDKITDVVKLREKLRSKDSGYQKMAPFIKTGQMVADALDPENPKRAEAVAWLKSEYQLDEPTKAGEVPKVDFKFPEPPEGASEDEVSYYQDIKKHFDDVIVPYTGELVAKAVEQLRRELRSEIDEPLTEYRTSREQAAFEKRVDDEWPQAQKVMNLAKIEATRDDLKAAMKEFKPLLDAGTHKPYEVLKLYKSAGKKAEVSKPKQSTPAMPQSGQRVERKATPIKADDTVNDIVDRWFDSKASA